MAESFPTRIRCDINEVYQIDLQYFSNGGTLYSIVSQPINGNAVINGSIITYTANDIYGSAGYIAYAVDGVISSIEIFIGNGRSLSPPIWQIYDEFPNRVGKPDTTTYGLVNHQMLYGSSLWEDYGVNDPDNEDDKGNPFSSYEVPNATRVDWIINTAYPEITSFSIDIEHWPLNGKWVAGNPDGGDPTDFSATDAEVIEYAAKYAAIFELFRERAALVGKTLELGCYGFTPIREFWIPQETFPSENWYKWQRENDRLVAISDAQDYSYPSIYPFYARAANDDMERWKTYVLANINESRRMKPGQPVIPVIWNRWHNSTLGTGWDYSNKLLQAQVFRVMLETCREHADGVVIWDGDYTVWDDQEGWWLETKRLLNIIHVNKNTDIIINKDDTPTIHPIRKEYIIIDGEPKECITRHKIMDNTHKLIYPTFIPNSITGMVFQWEFENSILRDIHPDHTGARDILPGIGVGDGGGGGLNFSGLGSYVEGSDILGFGDGYTIQVKGIYHPTTGGGHQTIWNAATNTKLSIRVLNTGLMSFQVGWTSHGVYSWDNYDAGLVDGEEFDVTFKYVHSTKLATVYIDGVLTDTLTISSVDPGDLNKTGWILGKRATDGLENCECTITYLKMINNAGSVLYEDELQVYSGTVTIPTTGTSATIVNNYGVGLFNQPTSSNDPEGDDDYNIRGFAWDDTNYPGDKFPISTDPLDYDALPEPHPEFDSNGTEFTFWVASHVRYTPVLVSGTTYVLPIDMVPEIYAADIDRLLMDISGIAQNIDISITGSYSNNRLFIGTHGGNVAAILYSNPVTGNNLIEIKKYLGII